MKLSDLLKPIDDLQYIRVVDALNTIYLGELGEWEDSGDYGAWRVARIYVGVFGTLTINIENEEGKK